MSHRPKPDWKEEEEKPTDIFPTRIKLRVVDKKQIGVNP